MPLTYLLVDFENVKPTADELRQLRGDHIRLWIFRGSQQKTFAADVAEAWQPLGAQVKFIHCTKTGKNALDFHIAFCLGMAHRENVAANRLARYVVVSNDGGFDTLFEFARSERCHVTKAPTILAAIDAADAMDLVESPAAIGLLPKLPPPASPKTPPALGSQEHSTKSVPPAKNTAKKTAAKRSTMNTDDFAKVVAYLRDQSKNRPGKRTTLEHHVVHILGNQVQESIARSVVERLIQEKVLVVTNNKLEYRLPKK